MADGEGGTATEVPGPPQSQPESARAALAAASGYLFASYSLKAHPDEGGLTAAQAEQVRDWKRRLAAAGAAALASFAEAAGGDPGGALAVRPGSIVVDPFSGELADRLGAAADPAADPADPASLAAGLAELPEQVRAAAAAAGPDGPPFDPVRPVVASPAVADRSPGRTPITDPLTRAVAELFNDAWQTTLLALAQSAPSDPATGEVADRLLRSVVRPLGEALTRLPAGDDAPGRRAGATFADLAAGGDPTGSPAIPERLWRMARAGTRLVPEPALPAEALEAVAGLQDLACRSVPADQLAARVAELRSIQTDRPAGIQTVPNGPYLVTNVDDLVTALGEPIPAPPTVALCRCGQSERKPFCDGRHAQVEFTDQKDPNRVADRRDTYQGLQATIFDNRGICAHSGFCTDRLATVFRRGEEPFVAPSGGRLDDIVGAVRGCPSGALSYGIDRQEAREQVDQQRPPRIEVSQDGPYRITGGIPLRGPDGADLPRLAGASREHYSLCRCGQSQNKPFCSGMHWYVDFHDPPPPEEPTLFQWVGGLPALLRLTRTFYAKYVPEDPFLAPLFANMSPDHPERVASWLSEVFGGPRFYTDQYGGYPRMVSEHIGKGITEAHRSHWVSLLCRAADDVHLPADPEFRAAFVAYLEWGSRIAVENSTVGATPPEGMPVPRWWWVCEATPAARVSALAPDDQATEAPAELPAEGEPVSFERHVKPLFRDRDRRSMRFAFDLWSYDDVRERGSAILDRLRNGTMPCDGAWPEEKIAVFARWLDSGSPG